MKLTASMLMLAATAGIAALAASTSRHGERKEPRDATERAEVSVQAPSETDSWFI